MKSMSITMLSASTCTTAPMRTESVAGMVNGEISDEMSSVPMHWAMLPS